MAKSDKAVNEVDSSAYNSDGEREFRSSNNVSDQKSYSNYLVSEFQKHFDFTDPDDLQAAVGLMLHNYADRVFNSADIRGPYKEMKDEMLAIHDEQFITATVKIKDFIDRNCMDILDGLNTINESSSQLSNERNYVQIYNYIFNDDLDLPKGVMSKLPPGHSNTRGVLQNKLREYVKQKGPIDLSSPGSENLTLEVRVDREPENEEHEKDTGLKLLVYSQIVGRRDRREMKEVVSTGSSKASTLSSSVSTSSAKGDEEEEPDRTKLMHFLYRSSKERTVLPSLGTYKKSIKKLFGKDEEEASVAVSGIKNLVSDGILQQNDDSSQKLTHLMFVTEVQRSRATALTSAMFIEEVDREGTYDPNKFPMAMQGAVDAVRDIDEKYKELLPVHRRYDEGKAKKEEGDKILKLESTLFADWLKNNEESGISDAIESIKFAFNLKKMTHNNSAIEPKSYNEIRNQTIEITQNENVPGDFTKFKSWVISEEIVETLQKKTLDNLDADISKAIEVIDNKILLGWYGIDTNRIFEIQRESDLERNFDDSNSVLIATSAPYIRRKSSSSSTKVLEYKATDGNSSSHEGEVVQVEQYSEIQTRRKGWRLQQTLKVQTVKSVNRPTLFKPKPIVVDKKVKVPGKKKLRQVVIQNNP